MPLSEKEHAESAAKYMENLADAHEKRAASDFSEESYHRNTAILYRARAADFRALLHLADPVEISVDAAIDSTIG